MVADRNAWPSLRDDCPRFTASGDAPRVRDDRLLEVSGLSLSRKAPGRVWMHNDSGDGAHLLAVEDGRVVADLVMGDERVFDAEDVAIADDRAGRAWLYLADTGDNRLQRKNGVVVLRTPEPQLETLPHGAPSVTITAGEVERLLLRYPTGPRDTEAIAVDPLRQELILISKGRDGVNRVFTTPLSGFGRGASAPVMATQAGQLHLGLVTAADLSPDGLWLLVRTYTDAWAWPRRPEQRVADAMLGPACKVPLIEEPQGEAVAWAPDANGYYTISEGYGQPLHFFRRIVEPRGPAVDGHRGDDPRYSDRTR